MSSYCDIAPGHEFHGPYHEKEYGFPKRTDDELFERLVLEMNQAGLSWLTILKKQEAFRQAYSGFKVEKVAAYGAKDKTRLMREPGIIRNRLKIEAAIENAKAILQLRKTHGSFAAWLDSHHPLSKEDWVKLFKKTFRFTGGEITGEFLISLGYLPGAHKEACPVYAVIARQTPPWMRTPAKSKVATKR
jgi:DNA-3-methyladenine glycosylase I